MTINEDWDSEVDLLVAGSGIGGLGTAALAAQRGATVRVVEKADKTGGTTRKSAGYMWVPNNKYLQKLGRTDPRDDALKLMARLSRPRIYDPESPTLGLPEWEYEGIASFFDHAGEAAAEYERLGIFDYGHAADFPDYYAHLPENKAPAGRVLFPAESNAGPTGGQIIVERLEHACGQVDVPIDLKTSIVELVIDDGQVVGAVIAGPDGEREKVRANNGVVLATGGFTHNRALRIALLDQHYVGGCAAVTNTGDILPLARSAGADLTNLNSGMRAPMVLERLQQDPRGVRGSFMVPGDSMLMVNRYGRRVVSEKLPYHDIARVFGEWDFTTASYPNFPLVMIWDEASERFGGEGFGNPIPTPGDDDYWVVTADSLEELSSGIAERLERLGELANNAELDPDFTRALRTTIDRWNEMAKEGVDSEFGRGSTPIEQNLSAYFGAGEGPNTMMAPLSSSGPYHATLLGPALIDTAGGPRCQPDGQVVRPDGSPITGLFAVGNCAAAPSGEAYWAGGHTLGFIQYAAYQAAKAAVPA